MEANERPLRAASRAWILVLCVASLPVLASAMITVDARVLLTVSILSGVFATIALSIWAARRARRRREAFEQELEAWAAERATQEERLRIARDLHDLTSHGLGMITVHAAATSLRVGTVSEDELRKELGIIEHLGRETMMELRRMLALLRTPGDDQAPLRPADTLEQLPDIVASAGRAGLRTRLNVEGLPDLPASAQLTICAVVREGLANALRHAGPTTVQVDLIQVDEAIEIEIRDDGPVPGWRPGPGAGHGIAGLKERLSVHKGTLSASPAGAGYRLHARMPIAAAPLPIRSSSA